MLQTVSTSQNRQLVAPLLWDRLVARVAKDEKIPQEEAERVMDSAIGFLDLCSKHPGKRFSPTPLVDAGWHAFIMYTKDYQEFCGRVAGRFIHHEPNDNPAALMESGGACATLAFMKDHGVAYDPQMWAHAAVNGAVDCDGGSGPGPTSECTCS